MTAKFTPVEIPIRDEFASTTGQFTNYDCYDAGQRLQIYKQEHVDLRAFLGQSVGMPLFMFTLDQDTMTTLDAETMSQLETSALDLGEDWTGGVVGKQSDRRNLRGLLVSCIAGLNTAGSANPNLIVDLLDGFADSDFISLAFPTFPLASVNLAASYIDFTSSATADFSAGPTASVAFNDATLVAPLTSGDTEMRFPRGTLKTKNSAIDLSKITGVRFRITATGSCTFRCMAIRLVSAAWQWSSLDINTRTGNLERSVPVNGALTASPVFPANTLTNMPNDWPVLFRADSPPSNADPRPVDSHLAITFNAGSLQYASPNNRISIYEREKAVGETTMLDLDSSGAQWTPMAQLDALGSQPDFGVDEFQSRTQANLDQQIQGQLDPQSQGQVERANNTLFASWIEATLQWNSSGSATLYIGDQLGNGYNFTATLTAGTDYIMMVDLVETSMRVQVIPLDGSGNILRSGTALDTTSIHDDFVFKRRKGRFGWYAHFEDGDAKIYKIRTRGLNYAEYRSQPLNSHTPVAGAALSASYTPDRDLLLSVLPGPWGPEVILPDPNKSDSGWCFRIDNTGNQGEQGVQSNVIYWEDFENTVIEFDLWFPSTALYANAGLTMFLQGENRYLPLQVPRIDPDGWQHMVVKVPGDYFQTGNYSIGLVQGAQGVPTTWWIDNWQVRQRVVTWEARGTKGDAWGDNQSQWLAFEDTVNKLGCGVLFPQLGHDPQVRAKARKENALITNLQLVPKYAELGNLVWADQTLSTKLPPSAGFSATLGFAPTTSAPQGNWVGSYGSNGYVLDAWNTTTDLTSLSGVSISIVQGSRLAWTTSTTDVRALESPDQLTRRATAYTDPSNLQVNLTFTNAYGGNLSLYMIDWDSSGRTEFVSVTDVLGNRGVSTPANFTQGTWMTFPINVNAGGTVSISIIPSAGTAVLSGIFLGGGQVMHQVFFNGSLSVAPAGPLIGYYWAFGDGAVDNAISPAHTYPAPGTYYPTLTVLDRYGQRSSYSQRLILA